jgi:hypothetical protein
MHGGHGVAERPSGAASRGPVLRGCCVDQCVDRWRRLRGLEARGAACHGTEWSGPTLLKTLKALRRSRRGCPAHDPPPVNQCTCRQRGSASRKGRQGGAGERGRGGDQVLHGGAGVAAEQVRRLPRLVRRERAVEVGQVQVVRHPRLEPRPHQPQQQPGPTRARSLVHRGARALAGSLYPLSRAPSTAPPSRTHLSHSTHTCPTVSRRTTRAA